MHAGITAAVGFLIAVLWFDLMFDVQVIGHRKSAEPPERVVDSMATYYRRVTTDASPMGRLISLVMAVLVALLVCQAVRDGTPGWVSVVSLIGAGASIVLALTRVVPQAVLLGARSEPLAANWALAQNILRDHVLFLALMMTVLIVQLAGG